MPLPPSSPENGEKADETDQPQLLFSHVECLLIAFHNIGRQHPDFLTDPDNADRLKDFTKRLQYFAIGSQAYFKQLKASLTPKSSAEKTEEVLNKLYSRPLIYGTHRASVFLSNIK